MYAFLALTILYYFPFIRFQGRDLTCDSGSTLIRRTIALGLDVGIGDVVLVSWDWLRFALHVGLSGQIMDNLCYGWTGREGEQNWHGSGLTPKGNRKEYVEMH